MNSFKPAVAPKILTEKQKKKGRKKGNAKPQGQPNRPQIQFSGKGNVSKGNKSENQGKHSAPSGSDTIRVTHIDTVLSVKGGNTYTTIPLALQATTAPFLKKLSAIGLRYVYTDVRLVARSTASALSTGQIILAPYLDQGHLDSMQDYGPEDLMVFASMTGSTRAQWTGGSGKDISCPWPKDTAYSFAINPRTMAYSTQEGLAHTDRYYCPSGWIVSSVSDLPSTTVLMTLELHYTIVLTGHNVFPPFKSIGSLDMSLSGIVLNDPAPSAIPTLDKLELPGGTFVNIFKFISDFVEDLAPARIDHTGKYLALRPGYYKIDATIDDTQNGNNTEILYAVSNSNDVQIANSQNGQDTLAPKNLGFSSWLWVKKSMTFLLNAGDWDVGDKINGVFKLVTVSQAIYEFMLPFLALVVFEAAPRANGHYLQMQTQCTRVYTPKSRLVFPLLDKFGDGQGVHVLVKVGWWFKKGILQVEFDGRPIPEEYYEPLLAGIRDDASTKHVPELKSDLRFIGYALARHMLEPPAPDNASPLSITLAPVLKTPVFIRPKNYPPPPYDSRTDVDWEEVSSQH